MKWENFGLLLMVQLLLMGTTPLSYVLTMTQPFTGAV